MILLKNEIKSKKIVSIDEDFKIKEEDLEVCHDILEVKNIKAELNAQYVSDLVVCKLHVIADLVLKSTRTLKPVDYHIDDSDEITLCFDSIDYDLGEDILEIKDDNYDFYRDIFSLVVTNIPLKIIGKDDPDYQEGDNWEVITEEEYNKRKKENIAPRMAQFANINLDDDDE